MTPAELPRPSRARAAATIVAFTWLNPHVYLDTVLLIGSISAHNGASRWWFALGAASASAVWFSALGFGSRAMSRVTSRPATWRLLDLVIGAVMVWVASGLVRSALG